MPNTNFDQKSVENSTELEDRFKHLPDEVVLAILENLDIEDAMRLAQTNKKFDHLMRDDSFWEKKLVEYFPDVAEKINNDKVAVDYLAVFIFHYPNRLNFAIRSGDVKATKKILLRLEETKNVDDFIAITNQVIKGIQSSDRLLRLKINYTEYYNEKSQRLAASRANLEEIKSVFFDEKILPRAGRGNTESAKKVINSLEEIIATTQEYLDNLIFVNDEIAATLVCHLQSVQQCNRFMNFPPEIQLLAMLQKYFLENKDLGPQQKSPTFFGKLIVDTEQLFAARALQKLIQNYILRPNFFTINYLGAAQKEALMQNDRLRGIYHMAIKIIKPLSYEPNPSPKPNSP